MRNGSIAFALVLALLLGCKVEEPLPTVAILESEPEVEQQPEPVAETVEACTGEGIAIGEGRVERLRDGSLWFRAGLAIDADGSPHAYHPDNTGLDHLGNAGKPGNWWGIVVDDRGQPVVQGPDDPAPGYYVSTTSLFDRRFAVTDPRRYVDAETVPYVVLPRGLRKTVGANLGDLGLVVDLDSGARSFAIFADEGPATALGEGSIALADALGLPSNPRRGGKADGVGYVVWPGSGDRAPLAAEQIHERGTDHFERWGGEARLARCLE